MKKLYQAIAEAVAARKNCERSGNGEWFDRWERRFEAYERKVLPSGSGWDLGTKIDLDRSAPEKLIFFGEFHHMDEHGGYDGWTSHEIWVRPSLAYDIDVRVTGRNRNGIKEYLEEMFQLALTQRVDILEED